MEKISKKLAISLVLGSILVLPGCGNRQGKVVSQNQMAMADLPVGLSDSRKTSLFDEDVDAFVLEDADVANLYKGSTQVAAHDKDLDFDWSKEDKMQMASVLFPYDGRNPRADQGEALEKVDRLAMKLYKEGKIICLKGHACKWHGTAAYNLAISQDRPETMKRHLVEDLGIPADRIKVFGVGNEEPVTLVSSKEGQAPNRRVEIYGVNA